MLEKIMILFNITFLLGVLVMLLSGIGLTGCIPAITGIKEWPTEHGPVKFITGADFSVGANGTDTVDNRRGINPKDLPQRGY